MEKKARSATLQKCIVICSGGMDSTTLLYEMVNDPYFNVVGVLSFDYGQRHKKELEYAKQTCKKLIQEHHIVDLTTLQPLLKGSALTDNIEVPHGHYEQDNMKLTVVPNRNMIMLSIAIGYAISKDADFVVYGAHSGDHHIYEDCRPEFVDKLNEVAQIANYKPIDIVAPYINENKSTILAKGLKIGVPYEETWTCYAGGEKACGRCGSCQERLEAFKNNNIEDPLDYISRDIISK